MNSRHNPGQQLARLRNSDPELFRELKAMFDAPTPESGVVSRKPLESRSTTSAPPITMESIVLAKGRPVLAIRKDETVIEFSEEDSKVWKQRLTDAQLALKPAIQAIGRIEVEGHPQLDWIGTGWLIHPGIVVTNRHVAREFSRNSPNGFIYRNAINGSKMVASIDFVEEIERQDSSRTFKLSDVIHIEDDDGPDIAFLKVRNDGDPSHIPLADSFDATKWVATVGYPARDSRVPDQQLMDRLFGNVYNSKRFAPGQVIRVEDGYLLHDCTTLGGNSGSPILGPNGAAVGLHFSGRYGEANYAVSSPVVAEKLSHALRGTSPATYSFPDIPQTQSRQQGATTLGNSVRAISTTIPIHITVTIGECDGNSTRASAPTKSGGLQPAPSVAPAGDGREDGEVIDESRQPSDYLDRKGYDDTFIGFKVPLPEIVEAADDVLEFSFNGNPHETELRYEHFSVTMRKSRRMCFFSAVNIDGKRSVKVKRTGWLIDPRIDTKYQIKNECYGNPPRFSRGHMTRREDPNWGTAQSASKGNSDSMHVTNAVPQMQSFNAGIWLSLEDYALDNAREDDMKISVLTGPVFKKSDPVRYGVKIPVTFWKVIAFIHDKTGKLSATGYSISQKDFLESPEFVFGAYETHQRSLHWIEQQTGLSFGKLTSNDRFGDTESVRQSSITDPSQIRW